MGFGVIVGGVVGADCILVGNGAVGMAGMDLEMVGEGVVATDNCVGDDRDTGRVLALELREEAHVWTHWRTIKTTPTIVTDVAAFAHFKIVSFCFLVSLCRLISALLWDDISEICTSRSETAAPMTEYIVFKASENFSSLYSLDMTSSAASLNDE